MKQCDMARTVTWSSRRLGTAGELLEYLKVEVLLSCLRT